MSDVLEFGRISVIGRHPAASNAVFLVEVSSDDETTRALYKPVAGERALWDFPGGGLARREVAAHVLSVGLGLPFVPTTVWREDAPHGPGSLQQWIDDATVLDVDVLRDLDDGWLRVLDAELEDGTDVIVAHRDSEELRAIAVLDALMNNADRKAGHLLRDPAGHLWAVDHGVAFHHEAKLRTVLWGFAGSPLPEQLLDVLRRVPQALDALQPWISLHEIEAVRLRAASLLEQGVFPHPSGEWPSIPWPIY